MRYIFLPVVILCAKGLLRNKACFRFPCFRCFSHVFHTPYLYFFLPYLPRAESSISVNSLHLGKNRQDDALHDDTLVHEISETNLNSYTNDKNKRHLKNYRNEEELSESKLESNLSFLQECTINSCLSLDKDEMGSGQIDESKDESSLQAEEGITDGANGKTKVDAKGEAKMDSKVDEKKGTQEGQEKLQKTNQQKEKVEKEEKEEKKEKKEKKEKMDGKIEKNSREQGAEQDKDMNCTNEGNTEMQNMKSVTYDAKEEERKMNDKKDSKTVEKKNTSVEIESGVQDDRKEEMMDEMDDMKEIDEEGEEGEEMDEEKEEDMDLEKDKEKEEDGDLEKDKEKEEDGDLEKDKEKEEDVDFEKDEKMDLEKGEDMDIEKGGKKEELKARGEKKGEEKKKDSQSASNKYGEEMKESLKVDGNLDREKTKTGLQNVSNTNGVDMNAHLKQDKNAMSEKKETSRKIEMQHGNDVGEQRNYVKKTTEKKNEDIGRGNNVEKKSKPEEELRAQEKIDKNKTKKVDADVEEQGVDVGAVEGDDSDRDDFEREDSDHEDSDNEDFDRENSDNDDLDRENSDDDNSDHDNSDEDNVELDAADELGRGRYQEKKEEKNQKGQMEKGRGENKNKMNPPISVSVEEKLYKGEGTQSKATINASAHVSGAYQNTMKDEAKEHKESNRIEKNTPHKETLLGKKSEFEEKATNPSVSQKEEGQVKGENQRKGNEKKYENKYENKYESNMFTLDKKMHRNLSNIDELFHGLKDKLNRHKELKNRELKLKFETMGRIKEYKMYTNLIQKSVEILTIRLMKINEDLKKLKYSSDIALQKYINENDHALVNFSKLEKYDNKGQGKVAHGIRPRGSDKKGELFCPLDCVREDCHNKPNYPTQCYKLEQRGNEIHKICESFVDIHSGICPNNYHHCAIAEPERNKKYSIFAWGEGYGQTPQFITIRGYNLSECLQLLVVNKGSTCSPSSIEKNILESRDILLEPILTKVLQNEILLENIKISKPGEYNICLVQFYQHPQRDNLITDNTSSRSSKMSKTTMKGRNSDISILGIDTIGPLYVLPLPSKR
ncbi:rhoptry neck protein 6 [Plasmodium gonderi]|uniref:Rhoptry neck protein 6 n=1 Tax=Plasmodium gonderi TaxID=77519 RepID=A0A1Y1JB31_PLAGO|nr:rhoptry neck protein 6 [Plasmodium gonderi]GAW79460.1 rhoptry neck protein 6 [Plasmodium gonderi]